MKIRTVPLDRDQLMEWVESEYISDEDENEWGPLMVDDEELMMMLHTLLLLSLWGERRELYSLVPLEMEEFDETISQLKNQRSLEENSFDLHYYQNYSLMIIYH